MDWRSPATVTSSIHELGELLHLRYLAHGCGTDLEQCIELHRSVLDTGTSVRTPFSLIMLGRALDWLCFRFIPTNSHMDLSSK